MLSFIEAYKTVVENSYSIDSERIGITESSGRILAEDVVSDIEMPPFNKSAMDGFACRREDLNMPLKIIEVIPAGKAPTAVVSEGECARIMTGAMVSEGADIVVKVEDTDLDDDGKVIIKNQFGRSNIAKRAEDVKVDDVVIRKGTKIEPQHIAIMAAVGWVKPLVSKKPHVGILSTGSEIVEPDQVPAISQIRNSNGYQLVSQVIRAGANATYMGIVKDNKKATFEIISKAVREFDIVILSGGVSMGHFDFIPEVFAEIGIDILFSRVSIQPGKPTVFGNFREKKIFGLPGNPVSSFTTFELFVRPMINKMMGMTVLHSNLKLPIAVDYSRKKAERMSWIPVRLTSHGNTVQPLEYHGSAHIFALAEADMMAAIPAGEKEIKRGELLDVRQV